MILIGSFPNTIEVETSDEGWGNFWVNDFPAPSDDDAFVKATDLENAMSLRLQTAYNFIDGLDTNAVRDVHLDMGVSLKALLERVSIQLPALRAAVAYDAARNHRPDLDAQYKELTELVYIIRTLLQGHGDETD